MHPIPRRRWFAFNLRTLFVVVTLLAMLVAWIAKERSQSRRELDTLMALGGHAWGVELVGPFDEPRMGPPMVTPNLAKWRTPAPQAWWRATLSGILGPRVQSFIMIAPAGSDLAPLAVFSKLKMLNLQVDADTDLRPLCELKQLQALSVNGPQLHDISALGGIESLRVLEIEVSQVEDLSPLARLKYLDTLGLYRTKVQDLSPLAKLRWLRELTLGNSPVRDISPLGALTNLQTLEIDGCAIGDLTPLAELKNLVYLRFSVSAVDLAPLFGLSRLIELEIKDTRASPRQVRELRAALPKCNVTARSSDFVPL